MKSLPLLGCILFSCAAMASQSDCIRLGELSSVEGVHDSEGHSCVYFEASQQDFIKQRGEGVSQVVLLNADKQPVRVLQAYGSDKEPHSADYIVPKNGVYYLDLQGSPGRAWKLKFDVSDYLPLAIKKDNEPISPKLQSLLDEHYQHGDTKAFWLAVAAQGTPLVEDLAGRQKRATFLWRGAKSNAYILGAPSGNHERMAQIEGTDIWYRSFIIPADTLTQYKIAPDIPTVPEGGFAQRKAILVTAQADPYNSQSIPSASTDKYNRFSLLSLAANIRQCQFPAIEKNQIKGQLETFTLSSKILNNERQITVYRPNMPMKQPAVLVLLDGQIYLHTYQMAKFFDGWMNQGVLPPMNIVFVDSISSDRRGEELPPNALFPQLLAEELMPQLAKKGVDAKAEHTIIAGSSFGGLGATWNALQHPEIFGNVLSMSGSYWWSPKGEDPEWLISKIETMPPQPIRFFLEAGLFEQRGSWGGIIQNHYQLLEVLKHKGYFVDAIELPSGHDYVSWCETLYEGTKQLTSQW
ncbi:alpha/beta hydrolase-fold protein [Providencia rettgeri]|uniref:alpha/beta hydrolase-fold protein n=1 Tax=Providencia rettgeri TaxID=587 RepID=UPI0023AAFF49|nr:alpha/beta hydrolase-fold protein [Providencia rettgeri]